VVEGILGNYSSYYAPAPLEITFLEDFHRLTQALVDTRPVILFSVPRFYEKLWERFAASKQGGRYIRGKRLMRDLKRPFIKRGLLKKSGLDRCAQFIVGSAPSSTGLLQDLRELGVEVHNAYGLTEAPLVTLNRAGRNRIDTVGEPLPMTELAISDGGEVLVRGPQVMSGYVGGEEDPLEDGWLRTGDHGSIDDGYLMIDGRIKEVMVTSYGKNVQPMRVESLLRSIPGVTEAMLVGEGRPFCVAILLTEGGLDEKRLALMDEGVRMINQELSGPERPKRWMVLPSDLSIGSGDLTANLKIRRSIITERLGTLIDSLYADDEMMVHVGRDTER
jgi:long-chain acyl-CoA synthetase